MLVVPSRYFLSLWHSLQDLPLLCCCVFRWQAEQFCPLLWDFVYFLPFSCGPMWRAGSRVGSPATPK